MEYNKVIIGFVVQSYADGECVRQEFITSDEVSREDTASGESIDLPRGLDGLRALQIADAAQKAHESGRPVMIG